jgi:hypothetical protein
MSRREKEQLLRLCSFPHATFVEVEHLDEFANKIEQIGRDVMQRTIVITRTVVKEVRVTSSHDDAKSVLNAEMKKLAISNANATKKQPSQPAITAFTPMKSKQVHLASHSKSLRVY